MQKFMIFHEFAVSSTVRFVDLFSPGGPTAQKKKKEKMKEGKIDKYIRPKIIVGFRFGGFEILGR